MVGTPGMLVLTIQASISSLTPWAGSQGKEEKTGEIRPYKSLNKTHRCWGASRQAAPHSENHLTVGQVVSFSPTVPYRSLSISWAVKCHISLPPTSPQLWGLTQDHSISVCMNYTLQVWGLTVSTCPRAKSFCYQGCIQSALSDQRLPLPYQVFPLEVPSPRRREASLSLPHPGWADRWCWLKVTLFSCLLKTFMLLRCTFPTPTCLLEIAECLLFSQ